ncbi:MAG: ABC transporter ATP-binding protein [Eubacterium sp.]|nr:ABC transporter ATP-binding protein [Eubacterium sp.]
MPEKNILLSVRNLSHTYHTMTGETCALKDISFEVSRGSFTAIVGASGCGKSTLLDLIAGYIPVQRGQVEYPLSGRKPTIGYMLQKDHLLEYRTVYENVILGLEIRHELSKDNVTYVKQLMQQYGIDEFAAAYPRELSGGMRQRAALIRSLAGRPDLLLLDEPFSALDYQTRILVTADICRIIRERNITTILVTHDLSEAVSTANQIIVLGRRPGYVRDIINVDFAEDHPLTAEEARRHPLFTNYYNKLWEVLKDDSNQQS